MILEKDDGFDQKDDGISMDLFLGLNGGIVWAYPNSGFNQELN